MTSKTISFQKAIIHYRTIGSGSPVVLIHGFAEDGTVWDNQVEFLKNDYCLIVPDLPGSGRSELIDRDSVFVEDYAECIHHILSAEKIDRCIMIGHSMGGYITLAFAEKFPEQLIAFSLFHSTAYADDETKKETRRKAISFIETNGPDAFLKTSIPGLFYDPGKSGQATRVARPLGWSGELMPETRQATIVARPLYEELIEKGRSFSSKALIQYYKAMIARPDRTQSLKNANIPVLFVAGEHDKAVPFKHSLEQSHIPFRSYIYVLRNSAHMGMLEEVEKANKALINFLNSC